MKGEIEKLVMNAVLEMAKKRQQKCNHLDIGSYVTEHYNKIMRSQLDYTHITINSDFLLFGKDLKHIKRLIDKESENE